MALGKLADPDVRRELIAELLCDPHLQAVNRDLDCFEVFAGVGSVAKAAAEVGHKAATFDKATNKLHDICTNDGFDRAVRFVMQIKEGGLLWAAPVCSSWVWMNSCKCKRSRRDGFIGDLTYAPVQVGNSMANATVFLMDLAHQRGVRVALENPTGSKIFKYKPLVELRANLGMHTVTTHRCAFDDAAKGKRMLKPYKVLAAGLFLVWTSLLFHGDSSRQTDCRMHVCKKTMQFVHCIEVLFVRRLLQNDLLYQQFDFREAG